MKHRGGGLALVLGLFLVAMVATAGASCSSSSGGAGLSANCSINSDCNTPLICAFGRCHEACAASRDCSGGERCVLTGTTGSCQLPVEATCSGTNATCSSGEVCGDDKQCRAECTVAAGGCANGDYCLPSAMVDACFAPTNTSDEPALIAAGVINADGAVLSDGSLGGGNDGASSGAGDGSSGGPETGPTGNSCPSAQTQFGDIAVGDVNPDFTSGVGARSAKQLLVFDSYVGPDPAGDGGGNPVAVAYIQAFDASTATSTGPAQPLFTAKNLNTPGHDNVYAFGFQSSAVAPTGEIALVYAVRFYLGGVYDDGYALYAAFLAPSADAGTGYTVTKTVYLETSGYYGQPHAVWSNSIQAFVFSWPYVASGQFVKTKNYLVDGRAAGGVDVVPTDQSTGLITQDTNHEQGVVSESGNLFGVAYLSGVVNYQPEFTLMDAVGTKVGNAVAVAPPAVSPTWVAVGGTPKGFVYVYDNGGTGGVGEVFLPLGAGDGGITGSDSDASIYPSFNFSGAARATQARVVSDNIQGQGGVGMALLFANGVSFAYVNADGVGHVGPNSVIARTVAVGDYTSLTTFDGSFVVSLYNAANHFTQVAASGCTP